MTPRRSLAETVVRELSVRRSFTIRTSTSVAALHHYGTMPATVARGPDLRRITMSRTFVPIAVARPARSSVKRCLFGAVDHDAVQRDLENEQRERYECFRNKYNFDLSTETPLPGRYEWECTRGEDATPPSSILKAEDAVATDATLDAKPPIAQRPQRAAAAARQSSIPDFFHARKRHPSSEPAAKVPRIEPQPQLQQLQQP